MTGVPALSPWADWVSTVTTLDGVDPSPEIILEIVIGSEAKAPTISHSGRCLAKDSGDAGYFWSISLPEALLNALLTLL